MAQKREEDFRINEEISASQVRLVMDEGEPIVCSLREALRKSEEAGLDLIEISPGANPPVCKLADYNKFLFERKKKNKEIKAKTAQTTVKEIAFGPNTADHDFQFKLKHARKFLEEGHKVKAYLQFRGREILFKSRGEILLLRFCDELSDISKAEGLPQLERKRMHVTVAPIKKK